MATITLKIPVASEADLSSRGGTYSSLRNTDGDSLPRPVTVLTKGELAQTSSLSAVDDSQGPLILDKDDKIKEIIKKTDRSDEEAWELYQHLKDFRFFNLFMSMTNELHQKEELIHIFKTFRYETIEAGKAVFEEGDHSNGKMYICLSGELLVMTRKIAMIAQANLEMTQKYLEFNSRFMQKKERVDSGVMNDSKNQLDSNQGPLDSPNGVQIQVIRSNSRNNSLNPKSNSPIRNAVRKISSIMPKRSNFRKFTYDNESQLLDSEAESPNSRTEPNANNIEQTIQKYGYIKDSIFKGGYFGERALESQQNRSASIVAAQNSELLTLSKAEYELIKKTFKNKTRELLDFVIKHLPGLQHSHSHVLQQNYVHMFEDRVLSYKNHLFHEGEKGDYFYLIYSGQCEVYINLLVEESSALPLTDSKIRPLLLESRKSKEKVALTVIKEGYLIGEELLYAQEPYYKYSVQVSSNSCKVLCINKANFRLKFSQDVFDRIREMYKEKVMHKEDILNEQMSKRGLEVKSKNGEQVLYKRVIHQKSSDETPRIKNTSIYYNTFKRAAPAPSTLSDKVW